MFVEFLDKYIVILIMDADKNTNMRNTNMRYQHEIPAANQQAFIM